MVMAEDGLDIQDEMDIHNMTVTAASLGDRFSVSRMITCLLSLLSFTSKTLAIVSLKDSFSFFILLVSNYAEGIKRALRVRNQVCQMPNFYPGSRSAREAGSK